MNTTVRNMRTHYGPMKSWKFCKKIQKYVGVWKVLFDNHTIWIVAKILICFTRNWNSVGRYFIKFKRFNNFKSSVLKSNRMVVLNKIFKILWNIRKTEVIISKRILFNLLSIAKNPTICRYIKLPQIQKWLEFHYN